VSGHGAGLVAAVRSALSHLRGTYGIAACSVATPDELVVARMGSPIVIGIGEDETLAASDPSAIIGSTREVMYLDDGELAHLTRDGVKVQAIGSEWVVKPTETIPWSAEHIQKGGYEHYMLKEIFEQPDAVRAALRGRLSEDGTVQLGIFHDLHSALKDMRKIHIGACGSAYYAGLYGGQLIERLARIPASVDLASEFRYRDPVMMPRSAFLAVSQSGETADTLAALRMAKTAGMRTVGIVNAVGSTIAREVDAGIYNHAGPEIGVASTKAFVSQLTVFALFALALGKERGLNPRVAKDVAEALLALPEGIESILAHRNRVIGFAASFKEARHAMYLGRALHHPIALEGALKIKEVSYIHAEGYAAGEMKHGPIALLEPGYPVVALAPSDHVFEKMKSNLEEVKARGAKTFVITDEEGAKHIGRAADEVLVIPETHPLIQPILSVVPLQLLAYEVAVAKGYDVDRPRNLAKSVTVE
jgi:glucosamine--fructose-6-phosphate aminotransferase (isomerizing)